jgi:chemotaxis protein MotB
MAKEARPIIIIKKVVKGHGGHHGGAWKVAYADFVTAMMAFFMVMWIISMDVATKNAIQGYFQDPVGFSQGTGSNPISLHSNPPPAPVNLPVRVVSRQIEEQRFRDIGEKIQLKLQGPEGLGELAAQVEVVMTDQGLRIELVEGGDGEMFFAFGSSNLKPAAAKALQIIAAEIGASNAPVVLEGHTDAAAFNTANGYTNWELSADRANAARHAMERAGISPGRVAEVRGYADRHPRVEGNPYDKSNRRISVLLPFSKPANTRAPEAGESVSDTPVGTS